MSAFTESAFLKKLSELNSSQQSIQTLSLWLIHHRKHSSTIVNTWSRELQNVAVEGKKLTFMYLANDVIQNSKKKGPEFGREFGHVLPRILKHISKTCSSEKLFGNLFRILGIWEERGVYESKVIEEFKLCLTKDKSGEADASHTPPLASLQNHKEKGERRKHEDRSDHKHKSKKAKPSSSESSLKSPTIAPTVAENGQQSPFTPLGDPPEPEELIKALLSIENSASSDAEMRERIANLPAEISEVNHLQKLADKEQAKDLQKKVNEAVVLLNDYNARLAAEMEERNKLACMLRNYEAEQKELLEQAERRLEEYKKKLAKMVALKKDIKDHMSNLPDLKQLPDVTGGLAPLPSAGDLFNH